MGYTVRFPSKVIEVTKNKDVVLKMLDDALHSCGASIFTKKIQRKMQ